MSTEGSARMTPGPGAPPGIMPSLPSATRARAFLCWENRDPVRSARTSSTM